MVLGANTLEEAQHEINAIIHSFINETTIMTIHPISLGAHGYGRWVWAWVHICCTFTHSFGDHFFISLRYDKECKPEAKSNERIFAKRMLINT